MEQDLKLMMFLLKLILTHVVDGKVSQATINHANSDAVTRALNAINAVRNGNPAELDALSEEARSILEGRA